MLNRSVAIVTNNRETLDGVEEYLSRAGARLSSTSSLANACAVGSSADAVLLFADDFQQIDARAVFEQLQREVPSAVVVVVTQDVDVFAQLARGAPNRSRTVILQRPAWGWMLLDAMRSGLADSA